MNKMLVSTLFTGILSLSIVGSVFADEPSSQESIISESSNLETSNEDYGVSMASVLWYSVTNNGYQGLSYGPWIDGVSGAGKSTLTLSKSVSVSNTYTGTLTAKKDDITAAIGFNISKTDTTTASYAVPVPAGKKYKIQYRSVYAKYKATQKAYSTGVGSSVLLGTDIIYPMKFSYLDYRYVEI